MGNAYQNASLIVTPNAYKASKIYALKPDDGSGDLSFSRAGSKMVRNSSGLWETIGTNIPPLHYPVGGGCPSWLDEAAATCLIPNSGTFIGSMVKTTGISDSPIQGVTSTRITKDSAGVQYAVITYAATIGNTTKYTNSLFFKYDGHDIDSSLESNSGNDWGLAWKAAVAIRSSGITITLESNCTGVLIAEANGWYRLEVSFITGTVTSNTASILIKGVGANGASFLVNTSNLTQSITASSPIVTTGSNLTRLGDNSSKTGLISSGFLSSTGGTWYCEFNNVKTISGGTSWYIGGSSSNKITFGGQPSIANTLTMWLYNGGVGTFVGNTPTGAKIKMCFVFSPTELKVFGNGALLYTITQSLNVNLWTEFQSLTMSSFSVEVGPQLMFNTQISNTEAINLVTL